RTPRLLLRTNRNSQGAQFDEYHVWCCPTTSIAKRPDWTVGSDNAPGIHAKSTHQQTPPFLTQEKPRRRARLRLHNGRDIFHQLAKEQREVPSPATYSLIRFAPSAGNLTWRDYPSRFVTHYDLAITIPCGYSRCSLYKMTWPGSFVACQPLGSEATTCPMISLAVPPIVPREPAATPANSSLCSNRNTYGNWSFRAVRTSRAVGPLTTICTGKSMFTGY